MAFDFTKIQNIGKISANIGVYRPPGSTAWDLPSFGHPLSQAIMPLFACAHDCLYPIGTAFSVGSNPSFIVTAEHNIRYGLETSERKGYYIHNPNWPWSDSLKDVSFYVLHQQILANGETVVYFWELEQLYIPQLTDLTICEPLPQNVFHYGVLPLSFDLPRIDSKILCIGYCDFVFPKTGIPVKSVRNGEFDWLSQYSHRFRVIEGKVKLFYLKRFDSLLQSPCFVIDSMIDHGLSGGPVLNSNGSICGVNSMDSLRFDYPATVVSIIQPLLWTKINFKTYDFMDLILKGSIITDGSEDRIKFELKEDGSRAYYHYVDDQDLQYVYDDFESYQNGMRITEASS